MGFKRGGRLRTAPKTTGQGLQSQALREYYQSCAGPHKLRSMSIAVLLPGDWNCKGLTQCLAHRDEGALEIVITSKSMESLGRKYSLKNLCSKIISDFKDMQNSAKIPVCLSPIVTWIFYIIPHVLYYLFYSSLCKCVYNFLSYVLE